MSHNQPWTHNSPNAKAFERTDEHFVEPEWVSSRLFDVETFKGKIYDPACGFGRIVLNARKHGYEADGSDIADRGWQAPQQDFFNGKKLHDNIVTNPPFDIIEDFIRQAIEMSRNKAALIIPTARLNAARWLGELPLCRIWLLTPRPSMPPGHLILSNGKITGGKTDYCWLVFDHGYAGEPTIHWLNRDV